MSQDRFKTEFFRNDISGIQLRKTSRRDRDKLVTAQVAFACMLFAAGFVVGALVF